MSLVGEQLLTQRDKARLAGVHPDLVRVIERAREKAPFMVLEGLRSLAQQQANVANGVSQTLHSRHLTGHAVDIAPLVNGAVTWAWPPYYVLARVVKAAAETEGVPVEWGGDWTSFKDGPHWQLPWDRYPA